MAPFANHKPPRLLLPRAIAASTCREPSHNQALLAASHRERRKSEYSPPSHLLPYKKTLVSFCISKTSTLVFPPHSAPFIIGWCRETYCSYISCNWSGQRLALILKESSKNELFPDSFSPLPSGVCVISYVPAWGCPAYVFVWLQTNLSPFILPTSS